MLTFEHLLGKPFILKNSLIQSYVLNVWQLWSIAGIITLGHQLLGVLSALAPGTRDSSAVRTSFFVILKNEIYFTIFFTTTLFPLLCIKTFFSFSLKLWFICEEYGSNLIVVGIATGRLRAGVAFCTAFYKVLVHTGNL